MAKDTTGVVNRNTRPKPSSLQASRASWLQYPDNPAEMYLDLFSVINAFERPLIPELVPVAFPTSPVPIREAIKEMWASRIDAYFSPAEFTPQELAAGEPLTLPSAASHPDFYPALWIENRLFTHLNHLWEGTTPAALVIHPYAGTHMEEAFEETCIEMAPLGLGIAEAGRLPSWQWPPWTGMLLLVRLGDRRFKHIKSLSHLLHYLNRQQRLTPVPEPLRKYQRHFKP